MAFDGQGAVAVDDLRAISREEFDRFRKLAYETAGIDLKNGKEHLVSARLGRKIRELNLGSYDKYYRHVVEDRTGEALTSLIDALTTNHTHFFREPAHFLYLRKHVLPRLRPRPRIEIWSAACSSGEEPYTLAFCLKDELGPAASKVRILATDISTKVLALAKKAVYPAERFMSTPPEELRRHMLRNGSGAQASYQVKPEIREMVEFRRANLMENLSQFGTFPVIFCRNVMIYFDKPTQEGVVRRLTERLEPGGYLFIGHAESLGRIEHSLQYVQPAVYRKAGGAPR
jgi:chemotaxis protein methyltransferase CheR